MDHALLVKTLAILCALGFAGSADHLLKGYETGGRQDAWTRNVALFLDASAVLLVLATLRG